MTRRINYSPFVYGIEVPFNGIRIKVPHQVTDKDGNTWDATPNGGGWSCVGHDGYIEDEDIRTLMLLEDNKSKWHHYKGSWRLARDIQYSGKVYPIYVGERGFVYPDELEEGEHILPVRIVAYRSKRDETKRVYPIVTQGRIVKLTENDAKPVAIADLDHYFQDSDFWLDPHSEILSHREVIDSIHHIAKYQQAFDYHPKEAAELLVALKELEIPREDYMTSFDYYLKLYINDKENLHRQLRVYFRVMMGNNFYHRKDNAGQEWRRLMNKMRGPESPHHVYDLNWGSLYQFLLNPIEYPKHYKL